MKVEKRKSVEAELGAESSRLCENVSPVCEGENLNTNRRDREGALATKKLRVLNLYAGIGGNRKLWQDVEVTAIEKNPKIAAVYKKLHPLDQVIVGDAHQYLKEHFRRFDFIWSSRPCQKHSRMMKFTRHNVADFPDMELYAEIIFLQHFFKGKWVVENVVPYYQPLIEPSIRIGRHLFWSNFKIAAQEVKTPKEFIMLNNLEGKRKMMEWLGIHFDENIYYEGNHSPVQVLRNCVHPELGKQIFDSYETECFTAR